MSVFAVDRHHRARVYALQQLSAILVSPHPPILHAPSELIDANHPSKRCRLASRGAKFGDSSYYTSYRNQVILGVIGIPGAFLAGWAVEQPYVGRKGTLAISAGEYPVVFCTCWHYSTTPLV